MKFRLTVNRTIMVELTDDLRDELREFASDEDMEDPDVLHDAMVSHLEDDMSLVTSELDVYDVKVEVVSEEVADE